MQRKPRKILKKGLQKKRLELSEEHSDDPSETSNNQSSDSEMYESSDESSEKGKKGIRVMHKEMFGGSKKYPCGYCPSSCWVTRIQEHFRLKHPSHVQVKEAQHLLSVDCDLTIDPKERASARTTRRKVESLLLNTSTFKHNRRVLSQKEGILCPVRLPLKGSKTLKATDFAFCTMCNGLFKRGRNLKNHCLDHCSQRSEEQRQNSVELKKSSKRVALDLPEDVSMDMIGLISSMRDDHITQSVKKDGLILYVGQRFLERDDKDSAHSHVRERMRKLAVLVQKMGVENMSAVIDPANWTLLCDTARSEFTPSGQMKLGIYVRRAAELLENVSIQSNSDVPRQRIKDFLHLLTTEWKHRIGHQAGLKAEQKRFTDDPKVNMLPVSNDVHTIRNHLDNAVSECVELYRKGDGNSILSKKMLACKATVFNKRRGMEFIKSTKAEIETALSRQANPQDVAEFSEHLSEIEKKLAGKIKLIRVKGKQGKIVPVLLEPDDFILLEYLIKDPSCSEDYFMFQSSKAMPYRGHALLHELTKGLSLEKPQLIRFVFIMF